MDQETEPGEPEAPGFSFAYDVVPCPACTKAHLINRKTGKLFRRENMSRAVDLWADPL
jgi:hypothetical protein